MLNGNVIYKDRYWYWVLGISAVVGFLIHLPELIALGGHFGHHRVFPNIRPGEVVNEIFFAFLSLVLLFILTAVVFGFNNPRKRIGMGLVFLSFLFSFLLSMVLSNVFYWLHLHFGVPAVDATAHHYLHPLRDFIISFTVTGSSYMIYLIRRQQQNTREIQELRLENIRNQYEALKNQLNPHMLFNSLNTLRSLIREEPDKAQDYTQQISNVLRYMLQANESKYVTLAEELEFIEAYTFLLKMRYEDNLEFEFDIPRPDHSYLLPPMSLQLLIENAVKHNEISSQKPLRIRISRTDTGVSVCNPVQRKLTSSGGTGIGLDNLSKRYRLLFDREITIVSDAGRFCVTIPLINPAENESTDR